MTAFYTDEDQIRALVERQATAVRAKDAEGLVADLAPDVVLFDVLTPLRRAGADDLMSKTEEWFGGYDGPIGYEVRDLGIAAGGDVGVCHFLYRVTGTLTGGQDVAMWVRMTLGLTKIDGAWAITHEHASVPFDAESGQASLDLEP